MNSYSSESSSSDEEEKKLKPLQPFGSHPALCKVIDILPGKPTVLHMNQNKKKLEVAKKDVACQTNISGEIVSHQLVIDEKVYNCDIL